MKKLFIVFFFFMAGLALANVTLPYVFSDGMVLQRDRAIPIWGKADPGERITVEFKNQKLSTFADASGNWKVSLNKEKHGGPYRLKITGKSPIVFKNVLVGDVWLCGGQSNMEFVLSAAEGYEQEREMETFPSVQMIKISHDVSNQPQDFVKKTEWRTATHETVGDFSAVAYFFAKKMYQKTGVPVGIISANWGGTNIETWIPRRAFEKSPYFAEMISKMPRVDTDALMNLSYNDKKSSVELRQGTKVGSLKPEDLIGTDLDDRQWPRINQPGVWEDQGYPGLDGTVWLRKTLYLKAEDVAADATLSLSMIDDQDVTYFNGTEIGGKMQYNAERIYTIPKNILKSGKNTIAVKVTDTGGGGGIYGEVSNVFLKTAANNISLAGQWQIYIDNISKSLNENDFPSLAYNAMIAPLEPFAIKGILWYQGESNAGRAEEYKKSFPLLISSWRERFGKNLPFYFVQLTTFNTSGDSNAGCNWCELREAQTSALALKNTGMAVTTDVGNPGDIHPRNKKAVGDRLSDLALQNGRISPVLNSYEVKGNRITVDFSPAKPLRAAEDLRGFEIAGSDGVFHPATAKVVGRKVEVSSSEVLHPVAARYGWRGDNSAINLFTAEGLPVSPFRTDDDNTITKHQHYQIPLK